MAFKAISAFKEGGGEGKPMYLKAQLSYAHTYEAALAEAHHQWRNNIFLGTVLGDLATVAQFDGVSKFVQPEELKTRVRISADAGEHADWIQSDIDLGFEKIILHNVGRNQEMFIRYFGEKVLPKLILKRTGAAKAIE